MAGGTTEFFDFAAGLLKTHPSLEHRWSDDKTTVVFEKRSPTGFDIKVNYDAASQIASVETDRGYHDHFHVDRFENQNAAFTTVFGLVRDLLTRNMRIQELRSNGSPRKWLVQSLRDGQWVTESSMGLLIWNFFGKRSHAEYQNDALPPREVA